jgi:hypothetical protein
MKALVVARCRLLPRNIMSFLNPPHRYYCAIRWTFATHSLSHCLPVIQTKHIHAFAGCRSPVPPKHHKRVDVCGHDGYRVFNYRRCFGAQNVHLICRTLIFAVECSSCDVPPTYECLVLRLQPVYASAGAKSSITKTGSHNRSIMPTKCIACRTYRKT